MNSRKVTSLREYQHRRAKTNAETTETEALADRPTRTEARADRRRADYRLRSRVLRGRGTPPPPIYRAARAALETARTTQKGTPQHDTRHPPS